MTQDTGQKGYGGAKDTIGSVDHITTLLSEKAKAAGSTTAQYLGKKVAQAKDATMETGKSAAKVATYLRDKALSTGWSGAQYSTEITMEGTKVATNAVMGVAEYAGQKASKLAGMSVDTAKGLAAIAGRMPRSTLQKRRWMLRRIWRPKGKLKMRWLFLSMALLVCVGREMYGIIENLRLAN